MSDRITIDPAAPANGPGNGTNKKLRQFLPIAVIAAAGFVASWFGYVSLNRDEAARVQSLLGLRADWRTADLQRRILEAPNLVSDAAAFAATAPELSIEEFRSFLEKKRPTDDAARTILWAPVVKHADRAAFEATASRIHNRPVSIVHPGRGQGPAIQWIAPPEQAEYAPILLFIDFIGRTVVIPGIDVYYNATRRAIAMRAASEARVLATPPVPLTGAAAEGPGFNVFVPVFPSGPVPATPEERRARVRGFAVGTFAVQGVLDKATAATPLIVEAVRVFIAADSDPAGPRQMAVYDADARKFRHETSSATPPGPALNRVIRTFDAFGQRWTLVYDFPDAVVSDLRSASPWLLLGIGILLTTLIASALVVKQHQMSAIETVVRRRTADLEAVRSTNQRIFETSVDLILIVSRKGDLIQVSPSALAILGYRPEEMVGRNGTEFLLPADLEATRMEMRQGRRSGAPRNFQCRYMHKDSRAVTLAWTGIWSAPEQRHYFIGRDMTERHAIEQQLRQSQKLEAVGQLTGGIAHDFNNMLGVIIGNLDLVLENADAKAAETQYLRSALEASMRGADLVRRLLLFSRRQPLSPSVFAVNDAIQEIEPLLKRVLGETVALETALNGGAGRIVADKHQLENALMNLCVNARDAMPSGGLIRIASATVAVDPASAPQYPDIAPGRYVTISVTDSGIGIAPDDLARVFEPFFTTKPEGKGTGLGLSMVYGFMRESGGTVKIYSELGHGTTVRLYFPASDAELSAPAEAQEESLPTGSETVLVAEDRVDVRAVAVAMLERLGYRVFEAATAQAALAVLDSGAKVDLVFSDIVMPGGMSGLELAQELRRRGVKTPILLTSGYASPQALREQAQKLGLPVIGKPYRIVDLAVRVRAMLDGKNGNGGAGGKHGK